MSIESLLIFTTIAFIAAITPGPAIMLVSSNSMNYGVKQSILTILGNITGLFLLSLFSILGLSTIILYSSAVFITVKVIGALYLIYLGFKMWNKGLNLTAGNPSQQGNFEKRISPVKLYLQGIFIALSNPKAIAFTTALFPQFIDLSLPVKYQFMVLIMIFMSMSFTCLLGYSVLASKISNHPGLQRFNKIIGKTFGVIFIGFGLGLATATQK